MHTDKDTLNWIGNLLGRSREISVLSVGDGPYGLMRIEDCGEGEKRSWRYVGFANAKTAKDFSIFLSAAEAAKGIVEMEGRPDEARRLEAERHAFEHVRWEVFCMNGVVADEMLERIVGI